ncbi:alpha/beta fold hydrolase [Streptomyces sp. NPDC005863]|uniref:alpha/beta fold hydrolase n=1 Tax=unclassified Streptomyces TaxID=2593676 RepID=UPI0034115974
MTGTRRLSAEQARRYPDYPFQGRWFDQGGAHQHYLDEGAGQPLLMLHGNPSWSYMWRHVILGLRGSYRCVAPDLMGMGLSDRPRDLKGTPIAEYRATELVRLLDHLTAQHGAPARGWTLVTHDWGGPIGLRLAHLRPGTVGRLVLLNTIGFPWPPGYRLPWRLRVVRRGPLGALIHHTNAFAHAAVRQGVCRPMPQAVRAAYLAPYRRAQDRGAVLRFVRDIPLSPWDIGWPQARQLGEELDGFVDLPVFIGWGMQDPVFDGVTLAEWTRRLPRAALHLYPYAGHYVMEDAADQVVRDLRAFLATSDVPPLHPPDADMAREEGAPQ